MLLSKYIFNLFLDLLRIPLVELMCIFCRFNSSNSNSINASIKNSFNFRDIKIIVHHFAPRGLAFTKNLKGVEHQLGLKSLFNSDLSDECEITCFVEGGSFSYLEMLKNQYPKISFIGINQNKFDFYSYLKSTELLLGNFRLYFFVNDNLDLSSSFNSFLARAVLRLNIRKTAIVGVGYNTYLTQSIFRRAFSPHIQTYGFLIKKEIFEAFVQDNRWYLKSRDVNFQKKQSICRILEQGLSHFILRRGYSIHFCGSDYDFSYQRRNRFFDCKADWKANFGDSRIQNLKPFLFS